MEAITKMQEPTKLEKFRILAEVGCKSKSTINNYERYIKEFTLRKLDELT